MATGDQADILKRLKGTLPHWYGDSTPILDALLQGLAWTGALIYSLWAYAKLQTRIKTATDGWLDMIAADFFGSAVMRSANQGDVSFLGRILANLIRERATRASVVNVLTDLTGRAPIIVEPQRPLDTGSYGGPLIGYGVAGAYGSLLLRCQAFVQAFRPAGAGVPYLAGYGGTVGGPGPGGYGVASQIEYATLSMVNGTLTDADIYAAIDSVKVAGSALWVRIGN